MNPGAAMQGYSDSVSCLHALEHFGLGRYGDPVDPNGYARGVANLAGLVREGGALYLSVPIGVERVEFNAHRVFDPRRIVSIAANHSLRLTALHVITPDGRVEASLLDEGRLATLAEQQYALGIFVFRKTPH